MEVPTDRLHKFLAIGGLTLAVASVSYGQYRYEQLELARVDAAEKAELFDLSYKRYASEVNAMGRVKESALAEGTPAAVQKARAEIVRRDPAANALDNEAALSRVAAAKQLRLLSHYNFMSRLWFVLGSAGLLGGLVASFFGFRTWLRQPKRQR